MKITWTKIVLLVVFVAAVNALFNWTSKASALLCLLFLGAALAHYAELEKSFANHHKKPLWEAGANYLGGAVVALLVISAAEIYLAYLYSCSSEFQDYFYYRWHLCAFGDYGPYLAREPGHYAWGERFIVWSINSLYEHAHELEPWVLIPGCALIALGISWVASLRRKWAEAAAAAAGLPPPAATPPQTAWQHVKAWFASLDLPLWAANGALIAFSLFGFGGGVVEGERESYRAAVAMLNAETRMEGDLRNLRDQVARRTGQVRRLQYLLAPNADDDPARKEFQDLLAELAQDIGALNAEVDKARKLRATEDDIDPYRPDRAVTITPAPSFPVVKVVDESEVQAELRRHAVPIIHGPVDPSGAATAYRRVRSAVKDYNDQDLPEYRDAQEGVRLVVYRKPGLAERDAKFLANLLLSAGLRDPEAGAGITRTLSGNRDRLRDARAQLACMNLILAFARWLETDPAAIDTVLSKYVTTPIGFDAPDFSDALARAFPGVPAGRTEVFIDQLRRHPAWEDQMVRLMRNRRGQFPNASETFNQSATGSFAGLLARACAAGLTLEDLQTRLAQL